MKALALLLATALPALAFPAAECAAFWLGRDDHARTSHLLQRNPADLAMAEAFRDAAIREGTHTTIASLRPAMAILFDRMILHADPQARAMHDRLSRICADAAGALPAIQGPP